MPGETPVNYLVDLFEPDTKRLAKQMDNLRRVPIGNMIDVQNKTEESIAILAEEKIELTRDVIQEINDALEEERILKADWRKATTKLKQEDRVLAEAWFTQTRKDLKLDDLSLRLT